MKNMKRCSCKVFDNITRRQRKCKNKASAKLGYSMCMLHTQCTLGKYAIIIQKIFRGNRARNKLNIYKNLPFDMWDRVLFWSKYNIKIKKYFKSCQKIYIKKFHNELVRLPNEINLNCFMCVARYRSGGCNFCKAEINYKGDYYLERIKELSSEC